MNSQLPVEPDLLEAAGVHPEGGEGVADVEDLVAHTGAPQRHRAPLRRHRPHRDFQPVNNVGKCCKTSIKPVDCPTKDGVAELSVQGDPCSHGLDFVDSTCTYEVTFIL